MAETHVFEHDPAHDAKEVGQRDGGREVLGQLSRPGRGDKQRGDQEKGERPPLPWPPPRHRAHRPVVAGGAPGSKVPTVREWDWKCVRATRCRSAAVTPRRRGTKDSLFRHVPKISKRARVDAREKIESWPQTKAASI